MECKNMTNFDFDYLFRISIIGDSGIGKTTILERFIQNRFLPNCLATIGHDLRIRTLEIDSKRCELHISDLAGQDSFKYILSSFYPNADGVLICFDITNSQSFRSLTSWLDNVKKLCAEQTPIFLIGTKSDLKAERRVSLEIIQTFAHNNHLPYIETSSKMNENVEKCFIDFARILMNRTNNRK